MLNPNIQQRIELAIARTRYAKDPEGKWITLESGTHVQVDKDGNITGGPAGLKEKGITSLRHFGEKAGKLESDSSTTGDESGLPADTALVGSLPQEERKMDESVKPQVVVRSFHKDFGEKEPWVAKISGTHPTMRFRRDFVKPNSKNMSGSGRTGTHTYHFDEEGLYEVGGDKSSAGHFAVVKNPDGTMIWGKIDSGRALKMAKLMDAGKSFEEARVATKGS